MQPHGRQRADEESGRRRADEESEDGEESEDEEDSEDGEETGEEKTPVYHHQIWEKLLRKGSMKGRLRYGLFTLIFLTLSC